MNTNSANNTKKLFIGVIVIMLGLLAGGWFYLQNLQPTFKIESDNYAYFSVDSPKIEIKLENPKDANSGTVTIAYDDEILTLEENSPSQGVTTRELENTIIFEITSEYFENQNNVISNLTFDLANRGMANFTFDETSSSLQSSTGEVLNTKFENHSFSIGTTPSRTEKKLETSEDL
jgi:hypothetical protein